MIPLYAAYAITVDVDIVKMWLVLRRQWSNGRLRWNKIGWVIGFKNAEKGTHIKGFMGLISQQELIIELATAWLVKAAL